MIPSVRARHVLQEAAAAAPSRGRSSSPAARTCWTSLKLQIVRPVHLIDINGLTLDTITDTEDGGLRIGALVSNTDLAAHGVWRRDYAVLSRALLAGASGQLRNQGHHGWKPAAEDPLPLFL